MRIDRVLEVDAESRMEHVKHRSASGDLSSMWDYDGYRGVIEVVMRLGSAAPIAFTIHVCAIDRPRHGAHPLARVDAESWRILPARFSAISSSDQRLHPIDCRGRPGELHGHGPCELHEAIGTSSHIIITNAPPDVATELESL